MGLVLAESEKDRAFLATKIGQLAIQINKGDAERCACCRSKWRRIPISACWRANWKRTASRASCATIPSRASGPVLTFQRQQGHRHRAVQAMELSRQASAHHGVGPLKLGHVAWVVDDPQRPRSFTAKVLGFRVSDWIDDLFVFMRCNADHHTVNFIRGPDTEDAPHGIRAEGLHPSAEFLRPVRPAEHSDHLGTGAARAGTQHRHLSPQAGRSAHRAVLRARRNGRRGARLFRAAALASGHAAAAEDLGSRQGHHIGGRRRCRTFTAADRFAGLESSSSMAHEAIDGAAAAIPRVSSGCSP